MVRVRRLSAVVLAGVALTGAAGCGGDDRSAQADAYVGEVNAAQEDFAVRVDRIGSAGRDDEATLEAFADAAGDAADAMRAIEPPDGVAPLHDRLVDGFDAYARETAAAEQAITSGDRDRVLAAQRRLEHATRSQQSLIRDTIAKINDELQAG